MTPALLSGAVLLTALVLFTLEKVRHDLVAIIALGASIVLGLVSPQDALAGFSDSAVIVVAAVLVIGRAIELTGVATAGTEKLASLKVPFPLQLGVLLVVAAILSSLMNNIAALAITMPAVAGICRNARLPAGVGLMPLAFATILGGMTTLIGTPANLILSSVREDQLGEPFRFFDMTLVGGSVAAVGLVYLCVVGWRLTPRRAGSGVTRGGRSIFELQPHGDAAPQAVYGALKAARAHVLAVVRHHRRLPPRSIDKLFSTDRLLVVSRDDPWEVAKAAGCGLEAQTSTAPDAVTARIVVGHGSPLIGRPYETISAETDGELRVVAAGPRAARAAEPLGAMQIQAGDQLVVHGPAQRLESYIRYARLLEVERKAKVVVQPSRAALAIGIYAAAVIASVALGWSTALTFAAATWCRRRSPRRQRRIRSPPGCSPTILLLCPPLRTTRSTLPCQRRRRMINRRLTTSRSTSPLTFSLLRRLRRRGPRRCHRWPPQR